MSHLKVLIKWSAAYTDWLNENRNVRGSRQGEVNFFFYHHYFVNSKVSLNHGVERFSKRLTSVAFTLSGLPHCFHEEFFTSLLIWASCCHDNSEYVHGYLRGLLHRFEKLLSLMYVPILKECHFSLSALFWTVVKPESYWQPLRPCPQLPSTLC